MPYKGYRIFYEYDANIDKVTVLTIVEGHRKH